MCVWTYGARVYKYVKDGCYVLGLVSCRRSARVDLDHGSQLLMPILSRFYIRPCGDYISGDFLFMLYTEACELNLIYIA